MLRFLTAGESHGRALVVILEGLPAGLPITVEDIDAELARRRLGYGRGPRMKFEADEVTLLAGIRHGRTLGSPVAIEIANSEWERKWTEEMSPHPGETSQRLTTPRPGHADLTGMLKYGFDDARNVLERASARETAARVAAGAVAKALLDHLGVEVGSHVVQLGPVRASVAARPGPGELLDVDESSLRCTDPVAEAAMVHEVKQAQKAGDSLGGVVEVLAYGVPAGLGSYVHWDRKLDGRLAQALLSIQAVKGVEMGDGFDVAGRPGSEAHDAIVWDAEAGDYRRLSTNAGGVEGGMSTGEVLVAHVAMKPLATLNRPVLATVDTATKDATVSFKERTDVTAVPAMGVVAEAMVALVLADEALRKFGGDSVAEVVRNHGTYVEQVKAQTTRIDAAPADGGAATSSGDGGPAPLNWDAALAFGTDGSEADDATRTGVVTSSAPRHPDHVVLIGMMGVGKSTVGERLATALGRPFSDSDAEIEARTGRTVRQIFADDGEPAFRAIESQVLADALATSRPMVIAAAGGVVLDPGNRRLLQGAGTVVWLRAPVDVLVGRVASGDHRPSVQVEPEATLRGMEDSRHQLYAEVADTVVDSTRPVDEVLDHVLALVAERERPPGTMP